MSYSTPSPGIYAPTYYTAFMCIADRCRHSCCVDWEICIDETTLDKYRAIEPIMKTVIECEDGPCFALTEHGRCPHLNEQGLCTVILSYGEDYLSDICRNHPRFFNDVGGGRLEAGLGIVCEEACRLILGHEKPFSLAKIGESEEETAISAEGHTITFDPLLHRDRIIAAIESPSMCYGDKLSALKEAYGISPVYTMDEWIDRFLALEILDAEWAHDLSVAREAASSSKNKSLDSYDRYYERLLTYFVYRHVSMAESPDHLRARLAFAILSVDIIRHLFETGANPTLDILVDLARRYSAEIEYSEDNTSELIFTFECAL